MSTYEERRDQSVKRCDKCHKETDKLYDMTPTELSDFMIIHVCEDCYEDTARELESDGYSLDL